jgi:hypothetical protein
LEGESEGIKTRLDKFLPVVGIGNAILCGVISADGKAVATGFSCVELKGVDGGTVEVVGDSSDVFELIVHFLTFLLQDMPSSILLQKN